MMMREFEVLVWASINSREQLEQEGVLEDDGEKDTPQKKVLLRLMMTAFYLKEKFCRQDEFEAIKTYFVINFP